MNAPPSPDPADPPPRPFAAGVPVRGAVVAAPAHGHDSPAAPHDAVEGQAGSRRTPAQVAKDIVLFFAAPFVTLAYLVLFPFIAIKLLMQAWRERHQAG